MRRLFRSRGQHLRRMEFLHRQNPEFLLRIAEHTAHGRIDLAADVADKTIANALKNGVSEHYDAVSGKPLGVTFLGMSCTIATLMLDGLGRMYSVRAKRKGAG